MLIIKITFGFVQLIIIIKQHKKCKANISKRISCTWEREREWVYPRWGWYQDGYSIFVSFCFWNSSTSKCILPNENEKSRKKSTADEMNPAFYLLLVDHFRRCFEWNVSSYLFSMYLLFISVFLNNSPESSKKMEFVLFAVVSLFFLFLFSHFASTVSTISFVYAILFKMYAMAACVVSRISMLTNIRMKISLLLLFLFIFFSLSLRFSSSVAWECFFVPFFKALHS